ncbi:homeobox protein goosecoid-2 [Tachyglossus aculeatus]|uniref:homeobox protein goosecoid-2 n=1 Tax=Tachyglossus aculeatus TaxID=9261 RepID=UPI0018F60BA9|nr:homeobox protein goosecoid-2 [Tachyglossus aculeatus]
MSSASPSGTGAPGRRAARKPCSFTIDDILARPPERDPTSLPPFCLQAGVPNGGDPGPCGLRAPSGALRDRSRDREEAESAVCGCGCCCCCPPLHPVGTRPPRDPAAWIGEKVSNVALRGPSRPAADCRFPWSVKLLPAPGRAGKGPRGPPLQPPQRRTRRHRTIFSEEQLQALETLFLQNPYPDVLTREHLASRIHLKEERVEVWFKNRRAKWRHQKRASASALLLQGPDAPEDSF